MLKTVLLVTTNRVHRTMYENGLKKYFRLQVSSSPKEAEGQIDAVIYDIPRGHGSVDLSWLNAQGVPVVVLTPEDALPVPQGLSRLVLTYPVSIPRILKALHALGVEAAASTD